MYIPIINNSSALFKYLNIQMLSLQRVYRYKGYWYCYKFVMWFIGKVIFEMNRLDYSTIDASNGDNYAMLSVKFLL